MVNSFKPHVIVLPEDDATRALVVGFTLGVRQPRQIHAQPVARDWSHVREKFVSDQIAKMNHYPEQITVLLVDFDDQGPVRLRAMRSVIPDNLASRVFILGSKTDPEALKRAFQGRSLEDIGFDMAEDCRNGTDLVWSHDLLIHNKDELERLHQQVGSWLF